MILLWTIRAFSTARYVNRDDKIPSSSREESVDFACFLEAIAYARHLGYFSARREHGGVRTEPGFA